MTDTQKATHAYADSLLPNCAHGGVPCSICEGYQRRIAILLNAYDAMREALRAARLTLTSGGIAMDTVRQIDRALAAAEGKTP